MRWDERRGDALGHLRPARGDGRRRCVVARAIRRRQHLLNHTSGLSRQTGDSVEQFGHGPDALERNVRALAEFGLSAPPGTVYQYANVNYQVLGLLVQVVSGEPYGEYLERHVFAPLDMRHSFSGLAEARDGGLALGYRTSMFGTPTPATDWPYLDGDVPSGYLISSAEDMAHYLIAHLDGGRYGASSVLSPSGVEALHTPPRDVPGTSYAMGWGVESLVGRIAFGHSATTADSTASMTIVPSRGLGVVVLTNQQNPYDAVRLSLLSDAIATMLLGGTWIAPERSSVMSTVLGALGLMIAWQPISLWLGLRLYRRPARRLGRRVVAISVLAFIDAAVALVCLVVLPAMGESSLGVMLMFQPDLVLITIGLAAFALAWGVIRSLLLTARLIRRRPSIRQLWVRHPTLTARATPPARPRVMSWLHHAECGMRPASTARRVRHSRSTSDPGRPDRG